MLTTEGKFQEDLVQAGPSGYQPPRNPSIGYKLRFSLVYSIITVEKLVSSECYYSVGENSFRYKHP